MKLSYISNHARSATLNSRAPHHKELGLTAIWNASLSDDAVVGGFRLTATRLASAIALVESVTEGFAHTIRGDLRSEDASTDSKEH